VRPSDEADCVRSIKDHILASFPNDPTAPRLSSPSANTRQLVTPYFSHYAFAELIERGEMDFVLDQLRTCWGWALQDGRTTWVEVFDTRWSHCHTWCGSPTWQLSRYGLGLRTRFDLGANHFELDLHPGSLPGARGALPIPGTDQLIHVDWERRDGAIHYRLRASVPVTLVVPSIAGVALRTQRFEGELELRLPVDR
jgi:hypothetical protein